MSRPDPDSQPSTYPIGVVGRLTGIHPETLRIWERRYGLGEPRRTEGGGRLYSDADVRRLSLVKRLVDAGNPVRLVAPLSLEALEARVGAMQAPDVSAPRTEQPCRIAVLGETLPARLRQDATALGELQIVAAWKDGTALAGQSRSFVLQLLTGTRKK